MTDGPPRETLVSGTQVRHDGSRPVLVSHNLRLRVLTGPETGEEREVTAARITIGAGTANDLPLTDRMVSRRHCEIVVRDNDYLLRDLESTNGTYLNDTRVVEAILAPGSRLRVGQTEIAFEPKKKWIRVQAAEGEGFGGLVGCSAPMKELFGLLPRVARTRLSCLILGETGTGKELAARALHDASDRADGPFVVVDCGAVTQSLVESELFGHEKGAYTGADRARPGAFEAAHGGTLFLDEIGELSLDLQPKLLRALERREVKRLGANEPIEVDVRIVGATHRPIVKMVEEGQFRDDLYYRLAEVVVEIPPLRERPEDVALIAKRIVEQEAGLGAQARGMAPDAVRALQERPWPGNVRELRNVLRRATALADGEVLGADDLDVAAPPQPHVAVAAPLPEVPAGFEDLPIEEARQRWVKQLEQEYLQRVLAKCDGDIDRAAEIAKIHRKSFRRLLRQHGMLE